MKRQKIKKCHSCGAVLSKNTIGYQHKISVYSLISLVDGELEYSEYDTNSSGESGLFFCQVCGTELFLDYDDVVRILEKEKKWEYTGKT